MNILMKMENVNIIEHVYSRKKKASFRKKTDEIILHCSATKEGMDYTVNDIDSWHKQRNFSCIGYHFVIYRDGTIHRGRAENEIGAHCTNHNSNSIGICYIGGLDKDGKTPKNTLTIEQKLATFELLGYLQEKYNISDHGIHTHREYAQKACPSYTRAWLLDQYSKWRDMIY